MNRFFSRLLPAVLGCLLLSGCAMDPLDPHVSSASDISGESSTAITVPTAPSEPTANLNGYVWELCAPWANRFLPTGETESDLTLQKSLDEVRDLYHAELKFTVNAGAAEFLPDAFSGADCPDVIGIRGTEIPTLAASGALYSTDSPSLCNLGFNAGDKTRFFTPASSKFLYNGRQWTVQFASRYDLPCLGQFILCSGTLLEQLGAGNLHNLLETGKWTDEEYLRLAAAARELTGEEPVYGTYITKPMVAFSALGGRMTTGTLDTGLESALNGGPASAAFGMLSAMTDPANGAYPGKSSSVLPIYTRGNLLFLWATTSAMLSTPKLITDDVVVMPAPTCYGALQTPLTEYTGYGFLRANPSVANSVLIFDALALRLNGDWCTIFQELTGLNEDNIDVIRDYMLPTLTVAQYEMDETLQGFYDFYLNTPMTERTGASDYILHFAHRQLRLLLSGPDIPEEP